MMKGGLGQDPTDFGFRAAAQLSYMGCQSTDQCEVQEALILRSSARIPQTSGHTSPELGAQVEFPCQVPKVQSQEPKLRHGSAHD